MEETLIKIPGAIIHLIDRHRSIELASGEFSIVRISQGGNAIAVLARIAAVQWPLARDVASVKLDPTHYFFSLRKPSNDHDETRLLNYGLTFPSKCQGNLLKLLDGILENYSQFSAQKVVVAEGKGKALWLLDEAAMLEERSAAYWTMLAPNVEDYGSSVARLIAKGSGKLIEGILWCGDVTVDRLKSGEDILQRRMDPNAKPVVVSKGAIERMKRVKEVTKMSESVVTGILSGSVEVSGFFTSSIVNSEVGKFFGRLLPGEVVLASLDGFAKIRDAAEMVGKNVLQTSSTAVTRLVSQRYGEQAAEVTNEGLGAAGHAIGTVLYVFKIRKAFNPKSAILAKSAAAFMRRKSKM